MFGSDGRLRLHNPAFAACGSSTPRGARRASAYRGRDRLVPSAARRRRGLAAAARRRDRDRRPRADRQGPHRTARRQRGRSASPCRCRTAPRWSLSRTSPTRSMSSARCASATRRWKPPTRSRSISSTTSPTNCARRSPTSSASPIFLGDPAIGPLADQAARISRLHHDLDQRAAGAHQQHPRSRHHRRRRA